MNTITYPSIFPGDLRILIVRPNGGLEVRDHEPGDDRSMKRMAWLFGGRVQPIDRKADPVIWVRIDGGMLTVDEIVERGLIDEEGGTADENLNALRFARNIGAIDPSGVWLCHPVVITGPIVNGEYTSVSDDVLRTFNVNYGMDFVVTTREINA